MRTISSTTLAPVSTTSLTSAQQHSSWHSPVPYLFGGLAAMLGLIAFALLILACSYWKLSGQLRQNEEENGERDFESVVVGEKEGESAKPVKVYEEKILVIMAGDENPTFLATPACPNFNSLVHGVGNNSFDKEVHNKENCEKSEKEMENPLEPPPTTPTSQQEETQQQSQCQ